jgi:hypothetical protein
MGGPNPLGAGELPEQAAAKARVVDAMRRVEDCMQSSFDALYLDSIAAFRTI